MSGLKKYKLLSDGMFSGLENVNFPVEVDGRLVETGRHAIVRVDHNELALIGAVGELSNSNPFCEPHSDVPGWTFILGSEIVEAD
ncbi:MAG: hypothetical protein ACN2B6_00310 [Rickettsiales bacterium]